jgi:hypothetical protein
LVIDKAGNPAFFYFQRRNSPNNSVRPWFFVFLIHSAASLPWMANFITLSKNQHDKMDIAHPLKKEKE